MSAAEAAHTGTNQQEELPSCYGLYWEAVGDSVCVKCHARHGCLHRFATVELPRLKTKLGDDASDLGKLASASQVKEAALRDAITYAAANANNGGGATSRLEPGEPTVPASAPPAKDRSTKEPSRQCKTRNRSRRSRRRRKGWGEHTFKERWLRERARSPAIAKFTPGCKIVREHNGVKHAVQVLDGRYRYDGKEYATLYEVTKAIVGTRPARKQRKVAGDEKSRPEGRRELCNWSAARFFAAALKAMG